MIKVDYGIRDKTVILSMVGHAESQGEQNLVCASASTLFATFEVICLNERENGSLSSCSFKDEWGDGLIVCHCKDEDTYGELARALMFVITGLRLLATKGQVSISEI